MFYNIYDYRRPVMPYKRISINPNLSLSIFDMLKPGGSHYNPFTPIGPYSPYEQSGYYNPFQYYTPYTPYNNYPYTPSSSGYLNHGSYQYCISNCYDKYKDYEPMYLNCINQCMKGFGYR